MPEYILQVKLRVPAKVSKGHLEFIFRDFNSEWDKSIEVLEQKVFVAEG